MDVLAPAMDMVAKVGSVAANISVALNISSATLAWFAGDYASCVAKGYAAGISAMVSYLVSSYVAPTTGFLEELKILCNRHKIEDKFISAWQEDFWRPVKSKGACRN